MVQFVNDICSCIICDLRRMKYQTTRENSIVRNFISRAFHLVFLSFFWRICTQWARASSFTRFLNHTQRRTTVGRTPLDEWSPRRRDLYLKTHNSRQTDIHAPGGIRTHDLSRRAAADRLRERGQWDRLPPSIRMMKLKTIDRLKCLKFQILIYRSFITKIDMHHNTV